ncbi:MAG TPA: hypothetical protein VF771_21700, partial [Longimicrobiaceae bacterium]
MPSLTAPPAARRSKPAAPDSAVPAASPDRYVRAFRAVLAVCFAGSLALSYPLWISGRDYPLVPLFDGMPQPPAAVSVALFAAMVIAIAAAAALSRPKPALI